MSVYNSSDTSLNVGSFSTLLSDIPWIRVVSWGIGIVGFINHVFVILLPLGMIFRIDISTILEE